MAIMINKEADRALQATWGNIEKETLKKYLLIYGYGRWSKIRESSAASCTNLKTRSYNELQAFANDFVRTLFENLQTEKNELKGFLLHLVKIDESGPFVHNPSKDWGELMRATPWAKRLQLLARVQGLIDRYKDAKMIYLQKGEAEQDIKVANEFRTGNNLLNFLPHSMFYGQRPSVWWTQRHDIDLLIGTYKYGYANYAAMRADKQLSFYATEQVECQFNEFPYADNITRRLKKLVQIFGKSEFQVNLCF